MQQNCVERRLSHSMSLSSCQSMPPSILCYLVLTTMYVTNFDQKLMMSEPQSKDAWSLSLSIKQSLFSSKRQCAIEALLMGCHDHIESEEKILRRTKNVISVRTLLVIELSSLSLLESRPSPSSSHTGRSSLLIDGLQQGLERYLGILALPLFVLGPCVGRWALCQNFNAAAVIANDLAACMIDDGPAPSEKKNPHTT